MEFRSAGPPDFDEIRQLLAANGWEKRVADPNRFRRMMEKASRTVVAVERGRIVGFARALCDDASNGYVGTVLVAEDYRGRGIGREMVNRLIGDDPDITWVLRAGHGSEPFWRKLGFEVSHAAMERRRR
jgi:GNAT superfamily N-acetyltransferase